MVSQCKEERVIRHFAVVLALAVAAWTQDVPSEPHKRHVPRQAEVDTAPGCPGYHHRGISGACVLTTDRTGPIRTGRRATILPRHIPKAVASSNGPRRTAH